MSACVGEEASPFATLAFDAARWARYAPHMRRVLSHVHDRLDEPLDLLRVAEVACLSPHHWHRIYHAMFGETLAQTVKRLRLHRAASQLAQTRTPLARIARQAGYPDAASFTRTFKAVYRLPPARYRDEGQHRAFDLRVAGLDEGDGFPVRIVRREATEVVTVGHRGPYLAIGRAFDLLFMRLAAAGLARPGMRMFALFFDDPGVVPEAELRAQAAVAGCPMPTGDDELCVTRLPAGDHAVLSHTGPYASMKAAYDWLYRAWLPHSGREPGSGPMVEEYLNSPRDTSPDALRSDIAMPLQPLPFQPAPDSS